MGIPLFMSCSVSIGIFFFGICCNKLLFCVIFQWCPPCMRLLPEFRKASKLIDVGRVVNFGTVDCTIHGNLCNNVRHSSSQFSYKHMV